MITFPSVFHALRGEKLLKSNGIANEMIPVPRELTGSCEGLAARLSEQDVAQAASLLAANGVQMVKDGVKITRK